MSGPPPNEYRRAIDEYLAQYTTSGPSFSDEEYEGAGVSPHAAEYMVPHMRAGSEQQRDPNSNPSVRLSAVSRQPTLSSLQHPGAMEWAMNHPNFAAQGRPSELHQDTTQTYPDGHFDHRYGPQSLPRHSPGSPYHFAHSAPPPGDPGLPSPRSFPRTPSLISSNASASSPSLSVTTVSDLAGHDFWHAGLEPGTPEVDQQAREDIWDARIGAPVTNAAFRLNTRSNPQGATGDAILAVPLPRGREGGTRSTTAVAGDFFQNETGESDEILSNAGSSPSGISMTSSSMGRIQSWTLETVMGYDDSAVGTPTSNSWTDEERTCPYCRRQFIDPTSTRAHQGRCSLARQFRTPPGSY